MGNNAVKTGIALVFGLLLIFYVAAIADHHSPERTFNNVVLDGCYFGEGRNLLISNGRLLLVDSRIHGKLGPLSEIKKEDYVNIRWDQPATIGTNKLDTFANVDRFDDKVSSITLVGIPDKRYKFIKGLCGIKHR